MRVLFGVLALAAMVGGPAVAGPKKAEPPPAPITCAAGDDCAVKWGRALTWVIEHSQYQIRIQSDSLIQTAGPTANDAWSAFTVSKVPTGEGVYQINFKAECDNMFGCAPPVAKSRASFAAAVNGQALASR